MKPLIPSNRYRKVTKTAEGGLWCKWIYKLLYFNWPPAGLGYEPNKVFWEVWQVRTEIVFMDLRITVQVKFSHHSWSGEEPKHRHLRARLHFPHVFRMTDVKPFPVSDMILVVSLERLTRPLSSNLLDLSLNIFLKICVDEKKES